MTLLARLSLVALAALAFSPVSIRAQAPASQSSTTAPAELQTEMQLYYMVFLRRGPAWTSAVTPETKKVSDGHMANIRRLTKEGILVVAGPFEGQSGPRALAGIFILKVGSLEAAKAAVETDPAVRAGRFVTEIVPWWGPASLRY